MTRAFLSFVLAFSASGLVLADSAIKGAVLLFVAGAVALMLRRDSAATRHMVWLTAIVALLVVPVLSVVLPGWRVLPQWANVDHAPAVVSNVMPATSFPPAVAWTDRSDRTDQTDHSEIVQRVQRPAATAPPVVTPPAITVTLRQSLPAIWLAGCTLLLLRLVVARWLLWRTERATLIVDCTGGLTPHRSPEGHGRLAAALVAACEQLHLRRPVTLLMHPHKTIPVVWGILRHRLLLPEAAHNWSDEQLRSVLLHELAHIKRRDILTQLLTQVASALHWFNPLAWVAAWRMHVERERACDDLVLASGMRASAYAEHLLHIATKYSALPWTTACGLAMSRPSSLEGRLLAVLNQRVRRHRVTTTMLAATAVVAVGLAVPLAMLRAATDEANVDSETPASPSTTAAEPAEEPMPKHEYAQSLFRKWQARARTDGRIPGALVGQLDRTIADFIKQDQNADNATKLDAIRARIEANRDWAPADVATLLDEIAVIATAPIGWADLPMEFDSFGSIKAGIPLPVELDDAAWGQPTANGLRAAWLFEPRADQYALGTVLKARVLFHNAGTSPVVFKTETWHQSDTLTAVDANGKAVPANGTWYTGITPLAVYRLLPGEYCEVSAPGIAIGAGKYEDEFSTGAVGTILDVRAGDEISLSHNVDAAESVTFTRPGDPEDPTELWTKQAGERVASEGPLPASKADREQLINRVMLDLIGVSATADEVAAVVNDASPTALGSLAARIAEKPPAAPWTGKLPTGVTKFRVVEVDPDADKKPRAAFSPGRYVLGDNVHLLISQTTSGPDSRRTNNATIAFLSPEPSIESRHKPHEIALPDGLNSYAFLWQRNSGEVLLMQRGSGTTINFSDPDNVTSTLSKVNLAPEWRALLPEGLLREVAANATAEPVSSPQKPPVTLMLNADVEARFQWGDTVNGLRMALVKPEAVGEKEKEEIFDLRLVVQNVSEADTTINLGSVADGTPHLTMRKDDRILMGLGVEKPVAAKVLLHPREAMILRFAPKPLEGQSITHDDPTLTFVAELELSPVDGEWSGRLVSAKTSSLATANGVMPVDEDARQLFLSWNSAARQNGMIPGALIGQLGDSVRTFIKNNPTWETTPQLQAMLPRFDASHDWSGADAVALLDELAALQSTPIGMAVDYEASTVMQLGKPLPTELEDAPWGVPFNSLQILGQPVTGGLRVAYLLEPRGKEHPLNTPLNGRILIHNSGKDTIVFRTRGWHQLDQTAKRADGSDVPVESTHWLTRGLLRPYRLAPGEYVELSTTGIGIGANSNDDVWKNSRVGSWLDVKPGDQITLTPGDVPLSDWNEDTTQSTWWLNQIKSRLARHTPFPADPDARKLVLYRVAMELFGNPLNEHVNAAFVADDSLDAIASLLSESENVVPFTVTPFAGSVTPGTHKFRVQPKAVAQNDEPGPVVPSNVATEAVETSTVTPVVAAAATPSATKPSTVVRLSTDQRLISGRLLLPDGTPAADRQLQIDDWMFQKRGKVSGRIRTLPGATDSNGEFQIAVPSTMTPDRFELSIVDDSLPPCGYTIPANGRMNDVTLRPGRRVKGRVTSIEGAGVAGVQVKAVEVVVYQREVRSTGGGASGASRMRRETTSDADGFYELPSLHEGNYLIRFTLPPTNGDAAYPVLPTQVQVRVEGDSDATVSNTSSTTTPVESKAASSAASSTASWELEPVTVDCAAIPSQPLRLSFANRSSAGTSAFRVHATVKDKTRPPIQRDDLASSAFADRWFSPGLLLDEGQHELSLPANHEDGTLSIAIDDRPSRDQSVLLWKRSDSDIWDVTDQIQWRSEAPASIEVIVLDSRTLEVVVPPPHYPSLKDRMLSIKAQLEGVGEIRVRPSWTEHPEKPGVLTAHLPDCRDVEVTMTTDGKNAVVRNLDRFGRDTVNRVSFLSGQ